ncbi:MAG TPA: hypothetical protein VGZ23_19135 [bacterium]|nr:hypothetical protein [bacterium]
MFISQASKGGRLIADQIAPRYCENPHVAAAVVGGSVAKGWADEFSDLELTIFWFEAPSDAERKQAIGQLDCDIWKFDSYDQGQRGEAVEHLGLRSIEIDGTRHNGTVMVSVQHLTVREVEAHLEDVTDHWDTTVEKQTLVYAIQHWLPLRGARLLDAWQARAAQYPDGLARKMVEENLWMGPWFYPEAYASRNDRLVLYRHFCMTTQRLLCVLLGLNRMYHPSHEYKWLEHVAGKIKIAPQDLAGRLKGVFGGDLLAGGHELISLIHETLTLVEREMPEIDTRRERGRWQGWHPYTLLNRVGATAS